MTTILTRAARALCKAQSGVDVFDDLEPEAQEAAREHVRAVLEAMRKPDEAMLDAGGYLCSSAENTIRWSVINREDRKLSEGYATEVYQAMIDAALAD